MSASSRPLVAIPGRFSARASAIRFSAVLVAEALADLVWAAGGEPVVVVPRDGSPADAGERLAFADAVLLPGGGDVSPHLYGEAVASDAVYDVHPVQDAFDLAVARWALDAAVPLLAVCRGMQITNVALGGTLEQDMPGPHWDEVANRWWHEVRFSPGSAVAEATGIGTATVSCHHHQRLARLGDGLQPIGWSADGTVEAVDLPGAPGWFLGVQWHPEDAVAADALSLGLVSALVEQDRR
ncbi:MAG: gamma-glutamyl-gamma-aminobutyrate hydrolase family protein [Kineosporiaceae bacterium]